MRAISFLSLLAPIPFVSPLTGQMAYTAAGSQTSLTQWQDGAFLADLTEAKFGLTFVKRLPLVGSSGENAPELNFAMFASGAARKGETNLVGRLNLIPGFDLGGRVAYVGGGTGKGRHLAYIRFLYTSHHRNVIQSDSIPDTFTLWDITQRTFAGSVGFNFSFSRFSLLGFAIEGRRELSSAGVQKPREFCTPGTSPLGLRVLVCSHRYVGPLPDLWTAQVRSDLSVGVFPLASGENRALVGFTVAGSIDLVESAATDFSFAIGPSIHLSNNPGVPSAVLLFGFREIREANGSNPESKGYFNDHLTIRLALGIPFAVFTER